MDPKILTIVLLLATVYILQSADNPDSDGKCE